MRRPSGQAGFTLIELMVALVVSTVLIGMVLSIYTRMSMAYRTQQQVSELQQVLVAAQTMVLQDVRQAGYQIPRGFKMPGNVTQPAVRIINSATAPDEIYVFYADGGKQARLTIAAVPAATPTTVTVDSAAQFANNDVVLLVQTGLTDANPRSTTVGGKTLDSDGQVIANVAYTNACVTRIASAAGTSITFSTAAPYSSAGNGHCANIAVQGAMIYGFVGRGYRIDPTRKALSVLQMSPSGGLVAGDWQDQGIGFADMQIASRWFDVDSTPLGPRFVDTADLDSDPLREWYSGDLQTTLSAQYPTPLPTDPPRPAALIEVTVSFSLRTSRPVEGIASGATPSFVDPARVNNGQVGDRASIPLAGVPDASRPEELRGNHVLRYTTARIDVRNVGVGL